jgi:hypothetical protein
MKVFAADSVLIPLDQAEAFDLDPERHNIYRKTDMGDAIPYDAYPATVNAFHLLHCVNFLRQGLFYNVEYYRRTGHDSFVGDQADLLETHLGHCVDALRQMIMCQADDSVIPWLKPKPNKKMTMPDFARTKQCRNFTSLKAWAESKEWRKTHPLGMSKT